MAAYKMPCLLYFALLDYDMHSGLFDQEMRLWRLASFKRDRIEEFYFTDIMSRVLFLFNFSAQCV